MRSNRVHATATECPELYKCLMSFEFYSNVSWRISPNRPRPGIDDLVGIYCFINQ
jgi:hypothetical protein